MSILIGTILAVGFDASSAQESGFLACDGSAVDRTAYAGLFNTIGTNWGSGDGKQTFNLPDLRGAFVRGVDDGANEDPDAANRQAISPGGATGNNVGTIESYATARPASSTLTTSSYGDHTHNVPHIPTNSSYYVIGGGHYAKWNDNGVGTSSDGLHNHTITTGGDKETRPVNVYVDYYIYSGVFS